MTIDDVLQTRLTETTYIPPLVPTITVKNGILAIKGDISFISGLAKSGKSTICRYIIATALMPQIPDEFDTLGIRAAYCEGRPIIYIDTEQPKVFTDKAKSEIKRLVGVRQLPDNVYVFNWRHQSHQQNRQAVEVLFKHFQNAAYWIIDGITDFLGSANDEERGNELIRYFMGQADTAETTVIMLIHENQSTGKLRGHLGSEAERKCGGAISVLKDRETKTHWIKPKLIRGSGDFDTYAFQFDEAQSRFLTLPDGKTKELRSQLDKRESRLNELHRMAKAAFRENIRISRTDLINSLRTQIPKTENQTDDAYRKAIERVIKDMLEKYNIVTVTGEAKGMFKYLTQIEDTQPQPIPLSFQPAIN